MLMLLKRVKLQLVEQKLKNRSIKKAIEWHNREASKMCYKSTKALLNFEINMTINNEKKW